MPIKLTATVQKDDSLKNKTRALKREISKKASMANKRLKRLESNNLTDTPAYRSWVDYKGGAKFSVKGKSYNELQSELARVNNFINAKTSTVRGANTVLKSLANSTGISFKRVSELQAKANNFFNIASKVGQYLDNTSKAGTAIGYQQIWKQINDYVKTNQIDLGNTLSDVESMVSDLVESSMNNYLDESVDQLGNVFKRLNS